MRAVQTICYDLFSLCGFFAFRLSYTKPFLLNGVFDWRYLPKPISFRQCISQKHTIYIIVCINICRAHIPRCHWRNTIIYAIRQFIVTVYLLLLHYCLYKYMQSSYTRCHWRNTIIYAIRQFLIRIAWRTGHAGSFRIDLPASVFLELMSLRCVRGS